MKRFFCCSYYCCCFCCFWFYCCYCSCSFHKPTCKVWLKSGQEQLRYWWHWVCVVDGGGVKSFSCQTQLLSWVEVELRLWQFHLSIIGKIHKVFNFWPFNTEWFWPSANYWHNRGKNTWLEECFNIVFKLV